MTELWLTYTDADGSRRRVAVERDEFVVGRHSECDLAISDSRLSRRHARILRSGSRFTIEDLGSSNGTDVNGEPVFDPVDIRSGDVLNFGGLEAAAEIKAVQDQTAQPVAAAAPATPAPAAAKPPKSEKKESQGVPLWLILLAPISAAVLVVIAAGVILLVVARGTNDVSANSTGDDPQITDIEDGPDTPNTNKNSDPPANKDIAGPTNNTPPANSGGSSSTDPIGTTPTPANLSETAKVEINGAAFLRRIAQNDPRAFLTTEQAKRVGAKVKQFSSSSAVAENLNSARRNASGIKTVAAAKNLKPELLAAAAVAKLGTTRGDVVATAQSLADVLDKLSIQLGNELADDTLLTIAAYEQGAAGDTMKMRNMLQKLANETSESSRTIRTIWFLQKSGNITQPEFDRALAFLAIGTIAQNPKEFGVNAEPLNL